MVSDGAVRAVAVDTARTGSISRSSGSSPAAAPTGRADRARALGRRRRDAHLRSAASRTSAASTRTRAPQSGHRRTATGSGPFTVTQGTITLPIPAATVTVGRWTPPARDHFAAARDVATGPRQRLERPPASSRSPATYRTTSLAHGAARASGRGRALYSAGMPTDRPQPP